MPFTYRDRPSVSERTRGKSGEELLNELKSDLDKERRMFFDSPSWGTRQNSGFPRGFPFDEDRGGRFRSYLDDIANRHPEFADHLKPDDWDNEFVNTSFGRKRRGSGRTGEEESGDKQTPEASGIPGSDSAQQPAAKTEKVEEPHLNQFGLRNTVPLGPGIVNEEERRQRSMSAPPDSRVSGKPRRFISKCEIPVMNNPGDNPQSPSAQQQQPKSGPQEPPGHPKSANTGNVRIIPIQVEGRDEPVVNSIDTTTNFGGEVFREPVFDARLPRDFGAYQKHSPRFSNQERSYSPQPPHHQQQQQQPQQQQQQPPHQQSHPHPQAHQAAAPSHTHPPPHHHHPQQQQQQQHHQDETDSVPPPPPPPSAATKPEPPKDPITKVQIIQKEVEDLMKQVENFTGNSRTDKQYMMLDELLTRKLISLDDIETEGKENVRQARKDAIRSIQRCISTLENKVPIVENNENVLGGGDTDEMKKQDVGGSTNSQPMELDHENKPNEVKQEEKIEVDMSVNAAASESQ